MAPGSSSLDDPRERAETIQANHMAMTKFSGADDPNYKKVGLELRNIVDWISAHSEEGQIATGQTSMTHKAHDIDRNPNIFGQNNVTVPPSGR